MERTRAVATASDGVAAEAATALLGKGNAVDAVVAGVFAAAGASPSVLLGPVQILFGGAGLGLRAVDGRVRQGGQGAPRPRGFTSDQPVAPAARVGVSALAAALAAAVASSGASTLAQVLAPAIASSQGPRRELLKKIAQRGPSALLGEDIAGELVAACGRVAGGVLTRDDLDAVLPAIVPADEVPLPGPARRMASFAPWRRPSGAQPLGAGYVEVVAATDHRGLVAVACYERRDDGVLIEPLGLLAPLVASPVLRGEPRVRPGVPVEAAAPIALVRTEGAFDVAVGIGRDGGGEAQLVAMLDVWGADETAPSPAYAGGGALVGVLTTKGGATLLARRAV